MLKEFREFILRGNLVDLAVAVVIGTAFAVVVAAFVADLVTPLIAAVGGEPSFDELSFTINGSEFRYGHFINALLTFVIIAAVVFFFVGQAGQRADGADEDRRGRGGGHAQVPGVPQRHPGLGTALRVLHGRRSSRPPEGRL